MEVYSTRDGGILTFDAEGIRVVIYGSSAKALALFPSGGLLHRVTPAKLEAVVGATVLKHCTDGGGFVKANALGSSVLLDRSILEAALRSEGFLP